MATRLTRVLVYLETRGVIGVSSSPGSNEEGSFLPHPGEGGRLFHLVICSFYFQFFDPRCVTVVRDRGEQISRFARKGQV